VRTTQIGTSSARREPQESDHQRLMEQIDDQAVASEPA
jgi:hypothetical protein